MTEELSLAEFQQAMADRGRTACEFRCPSCGNVTSIEEWALAKLDPQLAPVQCIGRHVSGIGCDWAANGLIVLPGVRRVVMPDGSGVHVFPFADEGSDEQPSVAEGMIRHPERFARLCAVIGYPDQQVIDALVSRGVDRETAEDSVEKASAANAGQEATSGNKPTTKGITDPTANEGVTS